MTFDSDFYSANFDAAQLHNGKPFSTFDANHGMGLIDCAGTVGGGFWYADDNDCSYAHITTSPSNNLFWETNNKKAIPQLLSSVQAVFVCDQP